MKRLLVPTLLLACAAPIVQAGEPDTASAQRIHVDLTAIVESGAVAPVKGVTSAGQPNAQALQVFADSGYVAVIDLRGPQEDRGYDEAAVVQDLGLEYVPLPIVGGDAVSYENAGKLDAILKQYDGPVLLHCGSGNRVGALLALRESLAGSDDETALEVGRSAGLTRLDSVVKQRLDER